MKLKVNGEEYTTETDTIMQLLKELKVIPERVAVEVNLRVIKKAELENYRLNDGDNIERVYFVGGGEKANSKH